MFLFGSGSLWITPTGGNLPANPTPIEVGTLQDVSLDISFDLKQLYGQNQFPESIARGKGKITGKARIGRFNSDLLNQMMFAQTRTVGTETANKDENHAIGGQAAGEILTAVIGSTAGTGFAIGDTLTPTAAGSDAILTVLTVSTGAIATFTITNPGKAYVAGSNLALTVINSATGAGSPTVTLTVSAGVAGTVTVTNAATYLLDLGVRIHSTGVPMLRVTGTPTLTGTYSVVQIGGGKGIYTFSVADSGGDLAETVDTSYLSAVASTGVTQAITNQLMGYQPVCSFAFRQSFLGQEVIVFLYAGVIGKMMMASKNDDYTIPEIDFECFADASGRVVNIYAAE